MKNAVIALALASAFPQFAMAFPSYDVTISGDTTGGALASINNNIYDYRYDAYKITIAKYETVMKQYT